MTTSGVRDVILAPAHFGSEAATNAGAEEAQILAQLEGDGLVRLPPLVDEDRLRAMQRAFQARLRRMKWNNIDGYEKTEPYRHMVEDALTLDQGFVDIALHPLVKAVLTGYLGDAF